MTLALIQAAFYCCFAFLSGLLFYTYRSLEKTRTKNISSTIQVKRYV